jgi:hypothetical protein
MNDLQINELIAISVLNWTKIDDLTYRDTEGFFVRLTDWCNSAPHALDLAMQKNIAIMPVEGQWKTFKLPESGNLEAVIGSESIDSPIGKAICLSVLKANNIEM